MTNNDTPILNPGESHELLGAPEEEKLLVAGEAISSLTQEIPMEKQETVGSITPGAPLVEETKKENRKNHWKWIMTGLLITILLGVLVWVFFEEKERFHFLYSIEKAGSGKYSEHIVNEAEKNRSELEMMNRAKNERNKKLCESVETPERKSECLDTVEALIATQSGNLDGCKTLTHTGLAMDCHDTILYNQAELTENLSLCKDIFNVQTQANCTEMIDTALLRKILAQNTITEADCARLSAKSQNDCIARISRDDAESLLKLAMQTENTDTCLKILDVSLKTSCMDTLLFKKAISTGNPSLCDSISDSEKRAGCSATLIAKNENVLFAQYVSGGNINGCLSLSNNTLKTRCHDTIILTEVRQSGDITLCSKLLSETTKSSCEAMKS